MDESHLARFGGIGRLFGAEALPLLARAHVAVIGVGGVGSWTVEALARSGMGKITMIDLDDVCVTNTNRQLPALASTVGQPKAQVLAERIRAINPACEANAVIEFFTEQSAARLLAGGYDFVIDAVDRMSVKALIISMCVRKKIPVLTVGAAGGRRDPTMIRIADLGLAWKDELLLQVRRKLRKDHGFPKSDDGKAVLMQAPCVFSTESPWFPSKDGSCSTEAGKAAETGLRLDCAGGFGAAAFVTGAFGFAAAAEVVRRLAEGGATAVNQTAS